MRLFGLFAGLVSVGVAAIVACGSDDGNPTAPIEEAGVDAPNVPPVEAGPDTGAPGTGIQHGGTRIKIQGNEVAGGSFIGNAAFDTKLDSVCYPLPAEDGSIRCIPSATASANDFSDDQCTTRIVSVRKAECGTAKFGSIGVEPVPCDHRTSLFRFGAAVTPAMIYQKVGVNCTGSPAEPANYTYYAVTAPLAVTELVAMKGTELALTPAVRVVVWDGEDGSRLTREEFIDVARGKPCRILYGSDGTQRCVPRAKINNGAVPYSNATCTARTAEEEFCTALYQLYDDKTATFFESRTCKPLIFRAFPVGAKRATKDFFVADSDGGCMGPTVATRDLYDLGAEIAPATFPVITDGVVGGPRIVQEAYVSGGVTISQKSYDLKDTKLDERCSFSAGSDGKTRCFPDGLGAYYFADDKCKVPLGVKSDGCDVKPVKYVRYDQVMGCASRITHIYSPGALLDPQTTDAYQDQNGTCTLVAAGSSSATAYYPIGAEVPPSTFAEGTPTKK